MTTMVDGLRTTVVHAESPRATLLIRTPYDGARHLAEAAGWAELGITTVVQDVRGRYGSRGHFVPFHGEGRDGWTTLDWIVHQRWYAAPIVLYGTSYSGFCAVEAALAAHGAGLRGVGGVSVAVPALGLGETARTRDGSFLLESRLGWWSEHGDGPTSPGRAIDPDLLTSLPVDSLGSRACPPLASWGGVVSARRRDADRTNEVAALPYPLLAFGGTHDWFGQDTLDLADAWGGPSYAVIGPWDHSLRGSGRAAVMTSWIDAVLRGHPPVGVQVDDRVLSRWPECSVHERLPGGSFDCDPADPFPSVTPGGDLTRVVRRSDCLELSLGVRPGSLIGTPTATVEGTPDPCDWSVLLAVRRTDGRLEQIAHGLSPSPTVHLTPVATTIDEGDDVILIVAGHSFPRHARDLHGGADHLTGTVPRPVRRHVRSVTVSLPA